MEIVGGMELWGGPLDGCFVSEALVEEAHRVGSVMLVYRNADLRPLGAHDQKVLLQEECSVAEYKLATWTVRGALSMRLAYQRA